MEPLLRDVAGTRSSLSPTSGPNVRRRDIQGLRAVAVAVVILNHLLQWPTGGFVGVDIFFVVSGYLITGWLLRAWDRTGRISLLEFYRGRVRRLLPSALTVLAVTVSVAFFLFAHVRYVDTVGDALSSLFFVANWRFAETGTDYFQSAGPTSPLQHFWSLSVEEQFYFVWPGLIMLMLWLIGSTANRRHDHAYRLPIGIALALATIASFMWATRQTTAEPTIAYLSTVTRAWELGVGALVAVIAPVFIQIPGALRPILAWIGLGGIATAALVIADTSAFPVPWALLPVLSTALVIAANTENESHSRTLWPMTNSVMVFFGDISYSLYLWHFPVIIFGLTIFPNPGPLYFVLALALIVVISVWSYLVIEYPIHHSRMFERSGSGETLGSRLTAWRRMHTRRFQLGFFVLSVPIGITCFVFALAPPVLQRIDPIETAPTAVAVAPSASAGLAELDSAQRQAVTDALSAASWPALDPSIDELGRDQAVTEWVDDQCLISTRETDPKAHTCTYGSASAQKRAAIVGDSVALSWAPAIRAALGDAWRVDVWTMGQCPAAAVPVTSEGGRPTPACDTFHDQTATFLSSARADVVFLAQAEDSARRLNPSRPDDSLPYFGDALAATVSRTAVDAGHVVVLGTNIPFERSLAECYTIFSVPNDCHQPVTPSHRSFVRMEADSIRDVVNASFVSVDPWTCGSKECPAFVGTTPVLADAAHFTDAFARSLGPLLAATLRAEGVIP